MNDEALRAEAHANLQNIDQLNKQLKWLIHKVKSTSGAKQEKAQKHLDKWLAKHFFMKGKARKWMNE